MNRANAPGEDAAGGEGAELACWRRGVGGQRGGKGEVEKEDKLNGQACRVTYHNFVQKGCQD